MDFSAPYFKRFPSYNQFITDKPHPDTNIIVTIPCHNEPNLISSLQSLANTQAHKGKAEVIVLINNGIHANADIINQNRESFELAKQFSENNTATHLKFHIIYIDDFPKKHAGVGLARRTAMDEAVRRFASLNKPEGIITGFDADSLCKANYFQALERHFEQNPKSNACSIYFEHPLSGDDFPETVYAGIIDYELHLRYFKHAMSFTGFPYKYYTIGSSFAVKAETYCKEGGMSRRKAGEDFYFLQKIIALGKFSELNTTCVYPSPRISDRVPFGTGAAVKKIIESDNETYRTYDFEAFKILKDFKLNIPDFYEAKNPIFVHPKLEKFLRETDFYTNLKNIRTNSANLASFERHFFTIFNAFKMIRFLNSSHENGDFEKIPVADAAKKLFDIMKYQHPKNQNALPYLLSIRKLDIKNKS